MITQISASAGSGKTYAITARFLALLKGARDPAFGPAAPFAPQSGYSLQEILAATFTNKAAAEMKSRILSRLKQEALQEAADASDEKKTGRAGHLVSAILRHYDALNVRTIDSLLNTLVRLSALGLNLPPDFQPSFNTDEFYQPQYNRLMELLWQEDSEYAFLTASGAELRAALTEACESLVLYSAFTGFQPGKRLSWALWEIAALYLLEKPVPETDRNLLFARIRTLHQDFSARVAELRALAEQEDLSLHANFSRLLDHCAGLGPFETLKDSAYLRKDSLNDCLKGSKDQASDMAEWAYLRMKEAAEAFSRGAEVYKSALQALPLTKLARELAAMILAEEHETGLLPAMRLPLLAGRVLAEPLAVSETLCRLGAYLRHILLDEFQDTSLEQWAAVMPLALESLSQGGSLTYVGDVKQAIYNWRGGDARLFSAVVEEETLLAVAPEPKLENLPFNWRSKPEIIRLNNAFFSRLARPETARAVFTAMLGTLSPPEHYVEQAVDFITQTYSLVAQDIPDKTDDTAESGLVRLYRVRAGDAEGIFALVKERLAGLLQQELAERWRPGDIAILVRAHDEAQRVAEWLTEWSIPVVTENSFRLNEHPLIKSLMAMLAFLDYPADDLAFWNCISTPDILPRLGGPDLPAILDWAAEARLRPASGQPEAIRPLYQIFREAFPEAWETWFAPFVREAGLMSVYDSSHEIIKRFKLEAAFPDQRPFLRRFLELTHLAEGQGFSSLFSFLHYWQESGGKEKLPLPESMHAVRIMTVHQAKGLQFPVVILPFHHKQDASDHPLVIAEYEGLPLVAPLTRNLEDQYYPWRITADLERLNLIYVAWTRAVSELHAFITTARHVEGRSAMCRCMRFLTDAFQDSDEATLCQWEEISQNPDEEDKEDTPASQTGTDNGNIASPWAEKQDTSGRSGAPDDTQEETEPLLPWRPMNWLPGLKIHRSSLEETDLTPRRRGILAHLCLEHLRLAPLAQEGAESPEAADRAVDQAVHRAVNQGMRLFPLPLAMPDEAASAMRACLAWAARLPETRAWLERGQPEQSLMDTSGNLFRVDLLVDEGKEGLTAVEYKTGKPVPEHEAQVRGYLELLAAAQHSSPRPVRAVLVYLDEQFMREVKL